MEHCQEAERINAVSFRDAADSHSNDADNLAAVLRPDS